MITNKNYSLKNLPKCAVEGSIMGGKGICGAIGIGNYDGLCTSKGYCKHQVKEDNENK